MRTTRTDRPLVQIPDHYPTLILLYQPGNGSVGLGQAYCLQPGETVLGRDAAQGLGRAMSDDDRCSRRHASLHVSDASSTASVTVRDEDSKNGTFVNGRAVTTASLADGDVLRVGNTLFLLRVTPSRPIDAELPSLVGRSPAISQLRHRLAEVAPSDMPVLLLGEPGVGKELAARSLHERSRRPGRFVACNCAGLSESLADSLLFGHERGAFTGASERREGFFRAADGGTLFLDEVAELPLSVQAKLLRALQQQEILPVGLTRPLHVDVRIIAATNRNLAQAVASADFRDDLYSRLKGVVVLLPSLRDRREDILPLLHHLLDGSPRITPRLAEALLLYDWPHNVRELTHLAAEVRRSFAAGKKLDLPLVEERLQGPSQPITPAPQTPPPAIDAVGCVGATTKPEHLTLVPRAPRLTRETLNRLGQETGWNVSRISQKLGISRRQVARWLDKFGFARKDTKPPASSAPAATPGDEH